ncbi:ImmA/IrrE family metallo-endopeptidase [Clostridium paraputrificum]|uniref:ImmA/IrrE family metallo-endopeptidase n=1 Tax=Clostridium paraputrificum TaxID=29363 RepID=UPI000EA3899A|nr:ImmA/IrrE family metallo-endopeptidase [Clostridium paraputrificum]RKI45553.1 ImmA/IrrE family metallo-endopeptidase [Clostridium paraputrificum]
MEEIVKIAKKIKQLEECGELRIVYQYSLGANALVMTNSDKYCIVVDPNLSWEQQVKSIWHEAKHIYSHLNKTCSIECAETEAVEFSNLAVKNYHLISELTNLDF